MAIRIRNKPGVTKILTLLHHRREPVSVHHLILKKPADWFREMVELRDFLYGLVVWQLDTWEHNGGLGFELVGIHTRHLC
jgi:hypothetical protein